MLLITLFSLSRVRMHHRTCAIPSTASEGKKKVRWRRLGLPTRARQTSKLLETEGCSGNVSRPVLLAESSARKSHFCNHFCFTTRPAIDLLPSLLLVLVGPGVELETGGANNVLPVGF